MIRFIWQMLPLSIRFKLYLKLEDFQTWILKNETSYFVNKVARHLGVKNET